MIWEFQVSTATGNSVASGLRLRRAPGQKRRSSDTEGAECRDHTKHGSGIEDEDVISHDGARESGGIGREGRADLVGGKYPAVDQRTPGHAELFRRDRDRRGNGGNP